MCREVGENGRAPVCSKLFIKILWLISSRKSTGQFLPTLAYLPQNFCRVSCLCCDVAGRRCEHLILRSFNFSTNAEFKSRSSLKFQLALLYPYPSRVVPASSLTSDMHTTRTPRAKHLAFQPDRSLSQPVRTGLQVKWALALLQWRTKSLWPSGQHRFMLKTRRVTYGPLSWGRWNGLVIYKVEPKRNIVIVVLCTVPNITVTELRELRRVINTCISQVRMSDLYGGCEYLNKPIQGERWWCRAQR